MGPTIYMYTAIRASSHNRTSLLFIYLLILVLMICGLELHDIQVVDGLYLPNPFVNNHMLKANMCNRCELISFLGCFRYVDVSTVDVPTSKLISKHIKQTGASFLEVSCLLPFLVHFLLGNYLTMSMLLCLTSM